TAQQFECGFNVSCNGESDGAIDLYVQGGCLPYTYLWSTGATTEDLSGLPAGTYDVTVSDANGTTVSGSITLTEPDALTLSGQPLEYQGGNNISCNGEEDGSIDLTVTGGCAPYTFNWSNGETTEDISNLGAGTYTATVTDQNGCEETISFTLTQPDTLKIINPIITNVTCAGGNDGSIEITVTGGAAPYNFYWSNGATGATT